MKKKEYLYIFLAPPMKQTTSPNLLDDLMGGDPVNNSQMNGNDGTFHLLHMQKIKEVIIFFNLFPNIII